MLPTLKFRNSTNNPPIDKIASIGVCYHKYFDVETFKYKYLIRITKETIHMEEWGNNAKTAFHISNHYAVSFLRQKRECWKECRGRWCNIIIIAARIIVVLALENTD